MRLFPRCRTNPQFFSHPNAKDRAMFSDRGQLRSVLSSSITYRNTIGPQQGGKVFTL
jgi:hypothetical protein